jgi:hypothetical protein
MDQLSNTCQMYGFFDFCTMQQTPGVGWHAKWGHIEALAVDGLDAYGACCACGKDSPAKITTTARATTQPFEEVKQSIESSPSEHICVDSPVGWRSSDGESCTDYVAQQYCTTKRQPGPGWESRF